MILVDTSIWIAHLARPSSTLADLITRSRIVQHPFVTGEILAGNPSRRELLIFALRALPRIEPIGENDFHDFLESSNLWGSGMGFVDIHLVAAAALTPNTQVWTRDQRMLSQTEKLKLTFQA